MTCTCKLFERTVATLSTFDLGCVLLLSMQPILSPFQKTGHHARFPYCTFQQRATVLGMTGSFG